MAKRGRKPKAEKTGYFYENEENAIIEYLNTESTTRRNEIFNTILLPAFKKMIESIIRRYKLYVEGEDFTQTYNDTISYLLTKINNYRETIYKYEIVKRNSIEKPFQVKEITEYDFKYDYKHPDENSPLYIKVNFFDGLDGPYSEYYEKKENHYKAYSYCGTICKHYLIQKNISLTKEQNNKISYDIFPEDFRLFSEERDDSSELASELIRKVTFEIGKMVSDENTTLKEDEIIVGKALIYLFDNWEEVLIANESHKLQKSSILYFLREITKMETKTIRENMKPYFALYKEIKLKTIR